MSRHHGSLRRSAGVVGVLGIGIIVGTLGGPRLGAEAADGGTLELAAQIADLAKRVETLEKGEHKAPFVVKDASGREIFHVGEENGQGVMALLGQPGSIWMRAGDDLSIIASNSKGSASIEVDGEGGSVKVGDTSASVMIGSKGGNPVVQGQLGSEPVIDFTTAEGGPKLTVGSGSNKVEITTLDSQTGVSVDASGFNYLMGYYSNVSGFIASQGSQPVAALGSSGDEKFKVAIYNSGKPAFIAGNNGHSTGMFVHDPSGKEIANIDSTGATGGRLQLLGPGGKEIAAIGMPEGGGDGGALSLTQGGNKVSLGYGGGAGASLVFGESGGELFSVKKDGDGGKLVLGMGDRKIVLKTSGGEATLQAVSGGRTTQMGLTQKASGFVLGEAAKPLAALGDNGDNKPFLRIYENGGKAILSAGYESNGKPAFRLGDASKPTALMKEADAGGGELNLYTASGGQPGVNLGIGKTGRPGVRVYESGGGSAAIMGVTEDGDGAVQVFKGGQAAAGLEADSDGGIVFAANGGRDVALMKGEGGGGIMAIYGPGGAPTVRLVNGGSGGSMVISDSGGGDVLEARADPGVGGLVCVNYKNVEKCLGRGLTGMEGFH